MASFDFPATMVPMPDRSPAESSMSPASMSDSSRSPVSTSAAAMPVPSRSRAALTGAIAAGVALGAGELAAGMLGAQPSPALAVGGRFVDKFAASLKSFAVAVFGTNDKAALVTGTVIITIALGAVTGVLARRRRAVVPAVFMAFGAFGAWAEAADPQVSSTAAIVIAFVSVALGLAAFGFVWRAALNAPSTQAIDRAASRAASETVVAEDPRVKPTPAPSRRTFLVATGAAGGAAVGFAAVGRALARGDVVAAVKAIPLPRPTRSRPLPNEDGFAVPGQTPYVVRSGDFYRIDTALSTPRVDAESWSLEIGGMVDHPYSLTYNDLLRMPSVEEPVTLQCVSNEVGGDLVGNAVWQGVPLKDILDRAGIKPGAEQVFSKSVDGWTCGFPVNVLDDDRVALVAYAMNGKRLPVEHGFPARLVVSGLYGYVSATKWLTSIELTPWDGVDGYWVPRGWSKKGPIKLASRIDVPRDGASIGAGTTPIAGVAWRPATGVRAVEVSIDGGSWIECELGRVASEHTWVQWRTTWDATPGDHRIRVRAIDADGHEQITALAQPAPNGATGLHEVSVTVT